MPCATPEPSLNPPEYSPASLTCSCCCQPVPEALEFHGGRAVCRRCLQQLIANNAVTLDELAAILCAAVVV